MFLTPRIGGPDSFGTWTCVLFDEEENAEGIGTGPTEDDAVSEAKEHAATRHGGDTFCSMPVCRKCDDLSGVEILESEYSLFPERL